MHLVGFTIEMKYSLLINTSLYFGVEFVAANENIILRKLISFENMD